MLDLVACTKGPLLLQGRDPDGRVIVLERSEENLQLTWIRTRELTLPPNSTLCGDTLGTKDNTTTGQDKDRARHIRLMHRIGEKERRVLKLSYCLGSVF